MPIIIMVYSIMATRVQKDLTMWSSKYLLNRIVTNESFMVLMYF